MTDAENRDPAQLGTAAGQAAGEEAWRTPKSLDISQVREQRASLPQYVAAVRFLRSFATVAYIVGGVLLAIAAIFFIPPLLSGNFDSTGLWVAGSGVTAVVVGWQLSRFSKTALFIAGAATFIGIVWLILSELGSPSVAVVLLPIGGILALNRLFRVANERIDYLQHHRRTYGPTSLKDAQATLAQDPLYVLAQNFAQAQRRKQLRNSFIYYGVVITLGLGLAGFIAFHSSRTTTDAAIPFAQSVPANLNVSASFSTDTQQSAATVTITLSQYLISNASLFQLTHGETWTCNGVALTKNEFGDFKGTVPLLSGKGASYACVYGHGADSATLTVANTAIPVILSPKSGASFAVDALTGAYTVRWVPDKTATNTIAFAAHLDSSSSLGATSGEQPDDGTYAFTINNISGAGAYYEGPGTLIMLRNYSNVTPQGFGALKLSATTTQHIIWVPSTPLFASPTPSA